MNLTDLDRAFIITCIYMAAKEGFYALDGETFEDYDIENVMWKIDPKAEEIIQEMKYRKLI